MSTPTVPIGRGVTYVTAAGAERPAIVVRQNSGGGCDLRVLPNVVDDVGQQEYGVQNAAYDSGGGVSTWHTNESFSYSSTGSYQPNAADLTLSATAGKDLVDGTAFLAAFMGNLFGAVLTKTGNYLAGVIGALSVTGTKAAKMGVGGVLGIIMDGVTDADGAFVAILDGDSAVTRANAAYAVKSNNSTLGSGFNYGVDLQGAAHDGFSVLAYAKAAVRLDNNVVVISGAGVPTDGTTGDDYAGPGSLYIDITNKNAYIQASAISTPVWKLITRAA